MFLEDFEFGFADAAKEYSQHPIIFEKAFCDPRKNVDKLINSYQYILIGPKGVGKSAYGSKILSIADSENELHAYSINLCDFEFTTFAKTSIDESVSGTQRFKTSWDFIFLWSLFKILYRDLQMSEVDSINETISLLNKLGFSVDESYKSDVTKLSKLKLGVKIGLFDLEYEKEFNTKPSSYIERISLVSEKMINVMTKVDLNSHKIIIIIDGLDDILRYKKNKVDIIASMIRSIDYINDFMLRNKQKIKIVLLIREDIIRMINDPDINKIIQDGSIFLSWSNQISDLKRLVIKRFMLSNLDESNAEKYFNNLFPSKIRSKNSWEYILDYTLYKPRDILQFLKYCQSEYPQKDKLSLSETQNVLKVYSNRYFIEEMKNELAGFIDDELIISIPAVFRRLGGRSFDVSELNRFTNEQISKDVSINETKDELLYLFESGYVGQLVSNGNGKKQSVIFKYRNPTARIDYYQKFITHRGLHSGLGVRS